MGEVQLEEQLVLELEGGAIDESFVDDPARFTVHGPTTASFPVDVGCQHQPGVMCQQLFACCGVARDCIRCHKSGCHADVVEKHPAKLQCRSCGNQQTTIANECEVCSRPFARYFCSICSVFSNRDTIWHCTEGCGCRSDESRCDSTIYWLCRMGIAGSVYQHCKSCNLCFQEGQHEFDRCFGQGECCICQQVCLMIGFIFQAATHLNAEPC